MTASHRVRTCVCMCTSCAHNFQLRSTCVIAKTTEVTQLNNFVYSFPFFSRSRAIPKVMQTSRPSLETLHSLIGITSCRKWNSQPSEAQQLVLIFNRNWDQRAFHFSALGGERFRDFVICFRMLIELFFFSLLALDANCRFVWLIYDCEWLFTHDDGREKCLIQLALRVFRWHGFVAIDAGFFFSFAIFVWKRVICTALNSISFHGLGIPRVDPHFK